MVKPYITIDYELLKAKGFVNKKTGGYEKLIANDKLVYSYIKARLKFFIEEYKGEYFDTQEAIAEALCIDIKSARKSLTKFIGAGVLHAEKKKFKNYQNWRYTALVDLELCNKCTTKQAIDEDFDDLPF